MASISKSLSTVLPFLWRNKSTTYKLSIVFTLFLVFLTISLNLIVPIIFKDIVNHLSGFTSAVEKRALILLIAYGVCWTLGRLFEKLQEMIFYKPISSAITDYSLEVFKHIHSLSLKFHLDRETGTVAGSIARAQLAIAMLVTNILFRILPVFIEATLAFIVLWFFYGVQIGILVIGVLIVYLIINYFIMDVFKKADENYQKIDINVDKRLVDSLLNADNTKWHNWDCSNYFDFDVRDRCI